MARRTVLDSFLSTGGLLGRLHLTGDDILAAEATALAANVNLFDKSEAQVASALAGSIVLRAPGGRAYVITEDESLVWGALADGSRCVRFSHPTMNQGLAAGVMRGFHGFLPGAGRRARRSWFAGRASRRRWCLRWRPLRPRSCGAWSARRLSSRGPR